VARDKKKVASEWWQVAGGKKEIASEWWQVSKRQRD
jgi:hypothetical protein